MNRLFYAFALIIGFNFSTVVMAQEGTLEIEEIVVTVTKKSESTQDLALSIIAFDADDVEARQIKDIQSLSQNIPGFVHSKAIGSGASYSMRGYGSFGVGAATISSYVTASNGHSIGNSTLSDMGFFDIDRLEVLKGPQGTLYGRNAVGGVINFVTTRPSSEPGGYARVKVGDYDLTEVKAAVNLPLTESINSRIAVASFTRDGWVENVNTGNIVDDRNQIAMRLSLDWDLSDTSRLQLTYENQKGSDNRFNIGQIHCDKDPLMGCDPYTLGKMGQPGHKAGAFTGVYNLLANLQPSANFDPYAGATIPGSIDQVNHNKDPKHEQTVEFTTLEYINELENGTLSIKGSYSTRDYYHHQDNEYGVASAAGLPGSLGAIGLPPIGFDATFYGFSEYVTHDRQYEFSTADSFARQTEVTYISDYDGAFNFVIGYYDYHAKTANIYMVQSAALQMMTDMCRHPYNAAVFGPTLQGLSAAGVPGLPADLCGYGGTGFFTNLTLGLAAVGAAGLPTLLPQLAASPKYTLPNVMQGFFQDSHNMTQSEAIFGEMYFDLNETTELTVGFRYDDFYNFDSQFSALGDNGGGAAIFRANAPATMQGPNPEYIRYPGILLPNSSDNLSGKIGIKKYISEDAMVYATWTSASKAGGSNPNEKAILDPYLPEDVEYLEIGTKGMWMDGRLMANVSYFSGDHTNMIISSITDAGSRNTNFDAEISGFEGEFTYLLSETLRMDLNFLDVTSEVAGTAMLVDPLNIVIGTKRVPSPITGNMVDAVPGTNGLMNVGFTDAGPVYKFAGYSCNSPFFNPLAGVNCSTAQAQDVGGNTLPGAPGLSYNLALTKSVFASGGVYDFRVQHSYMGDRESDIFNSPHLKVGKLDFTDINVTYNPFDGDWYVGFWVKNLSDDRSMQGIYKASNLQGGSKFANYNNPRTMGISFGMTF
tara:strand:- start:1599 stop:4397 length:2799 start_codon:yes stop_codon:yes gene_type:complete